MYGSNEMHVAVRDCGVKLISGDQLVSTNQITVAILLAMYEVIREFQPAKNKQMIYHQ